MEKKFSGKIWKFGNDIDTDTIIPGKRGTIPDRNEMKKYAFELLKPEFGSTVQPGDILVAGTNFGCGSSREQAATVLSYNGVRCIIAKSFARIFFRNAFNSGILLLTCDQIQDKKVEVSDVLEQVYIALTEKGYNPVNQIVGYIMSGDPTYITSHKGARSLIMKVERDEILEELMAVYIDARLK